MMKKVGFLFPSFSLFITVCPTFVSVLLLTAAEKQILLTVTCSRVNAHF